MLVKIQGHHTVQRSPARGLLAVSLRFRGPPVVVVLAPQVRRGGWAGDSPSHLATKQRAGLSGGGHTCLTPTWTPGDTPSCLPWRQTLRFPNCLCCQNHSIGLNTHNALQQYFAITRVFPFRQTLYLGSVIVTRKEVC